MRERITFPEDMLEHGKFFFVPPEEYDEKVIRKKWNIENTRVLKDYAAALNRQSEFGHEVAKEILEGILELYDMSLGHIMQLLRVVITGTTTGPDLMKIISILGPQETSGRITKAVESMNQDDSQP